MATPRKPGRPDPGTLSLEPSRTGGADFSRVTGRVDRGVPTAAPADFSRVRGASSSTEQAVGGRSYTVRRGDTLSHIAQAHYGKASLWTRIYAANRDLLDDPDLIQPGQVLRIPDAG